MKRNVGGALESDAFVNASRELLLKGDAEGAERVLAPVLDQYRSDAPVLHLMGLIKKQLNQLEAAERHFRAAIAQSFDEGSYYNDLGLVLQARGEFLEAVRIFRAALALMPNALMVRVQIVRCLMSIGELGEAEREARAYIAVQPGPESWTLLGSVQRAQERHEDALHSAEQALKFGPTLRGLRYNHATALDAVGRGKEALAIYEKLTEQNLDTPDLALHFARALYADGRRRDAEIVAEQGVVRWPGVGALQGLLAHIRWLRGEGADCTLLLEAEIAKRPQDLALRLTCAEVLHRGGHLQKALSVLNDALTLAPDSPPLLNAASVVLDELDRSGEALVLLRKVAQMAPRSRTAQRNLLSTLMRVGRADEALAIVRGLREAEPDEQYLIASEATALRMIGDPSYRALCDYARFVRTYDLPAPRGYFTAENFSAAFAETLRGQHRTNAHPLDQVLRNGAQTGRNLLTLQDPTIKAFLVAAEDSVRDYVSRLAADAEHPLLRRKRDRYRYQRLWSTRLTRDGYAPGRVHDRGWISGIYCAALMPEDRPRDPKNGWLKFGEPNRPPPRCGPDHMIEPRVGALVLFPSYMWHGVVPFEGAERLTASFEVLPG